MRLYWISKTKIPSLKGMLDKCFGNSDLAPEKLGELVELDLNDRFQHRRKRHRCARRSLRIFFRAIRVGGGQERRTVLHARARCAHLVECSPP